MTTCKLKNPCSVEETRVFGAPEHRDTQAEDLAVPSETLLNEVDHKLERLFARAAQTTEGKKKGLTFDGLAANEMTVQKQEQLIRQTKALLFRDHQRLKRLKRIKSKAFRKRHRHDLEKEKSKALDRLADDNPEAAEKLREEYERKRAELRMQKSQKARKRWAQLAARFGGDEAHQKVVSQMTEAREYKDLLDKLARKKLGSDESNDEDNDDDASSDSDEDETTRYVKDVEAILEEDGDDEKQRSKGIHAMRFMQIAREKKKAELEAEAERFLSALQSGMSAQEAAVVAKLEAKDDFHKAHEDEEDPADRSKSFLDRKRKKLASAFSEETTEPVEASADQKKSVAPALRAKELVDLVIAPEEKSARKRKRLNVETMISEEDKLRAAPATQGISVPQVKDAAELAPLDEENGSEVRNPLLVADNTELVRLAFNLGSKAEEDFAAARQQEEEEELEKSKKFSQPKALPGWGSGWVGEGIKEGTSKSRPGKEAVHEKPDDGKSKPTTVKKERAVYSNAEDRKSAIYMAQDLPTAYVTASQHDAAMKTPVGKEWVPDHAHLKMTSPKTKVVSGKVIKAMKYQGRKIRA